VAGAVEVARLHQQLKEQALNSSHQLAEALDLVSVAMIIASVDGGTILRWNRAAADIYGYTQAEAVGRPLALLEPLDQRGALDDVLAALRRGESARSIDAVHTGKEGQRRRVAMTAHPMRNAAGKVRWALLDVMAY
jgi:PAS domain S-box-containing protein